MTYSTRSIVRTSFMMTGPSLSISIPETLEGIPELSSPLLLPNGGGRSVIFVPDHAKPNQFEEDNFRELEPLVSPRGHKVRVIEHREDDEIGLVQWYLVWSVSGGVVETHVRVEDGVGMLQTVIDNLHIADGGGGPPTVVPQAPLGRASSRRAGYHERIIFSGSGPDRGSSLELTRPGSLRAKTSASEGRTMVTTGLGIDIRGYNISLDAIEQVAADVRSSVRP